MKRFWFALALIVLAPITALTAGEPSLVRWSFPNYPPFARIAGSAGIVKVKILIKNDGVVESAQSYGVTQDPTWKRFAGSAEETAKKFIFDLDTKSGSRESILIFVFQLIPQEMPDEYLMPEKIGSNIFVIRAKVVPPDNTVTY